MRGGRPSVCQSATSRRPRKELPALHCAVAQGRERCAGNDTRDRKDEELHLGKQAYGVGIGRSKLRIPAAEKGTARNINTIAKLVELAAAVEARSLRRRS